MAARPVIQVDGLKDLQKQVRFAKDKGVTAAMRKANKSAAQVAVDAARPITPVVSGKLAASIKATSSTRSAAIQAGTAARVPYAGVIHYGWPKRNIAPSKFLDRAIHSEFSNIEDEYEKAIQVVAKLLSST